jgi:hypothetical protein
LDLAVDYLDLVAVECTLRLTIPYLVVDRMGLALVTRRCPRARDMIQQVLQIRVVARVASLALDIEDRVVVHRIHLVGSGVGTSYKSKMQQMLQERYSLHFKGQMASKRATPGVELHETRLPDSKMVD